MGGFALDESLGDKQGMLFVKLMLGCHVVRKGHLEVLVGSGRCQMDTTSKLGPAL